MKEHVQLFITCLIDSLFPEVGEAVVIVLNRAGVGVDLPAGQTCCGQPAFNAGFEPEAQRMAMHTIELLENTEGPVLIPSGSCAAMMLHGYPELFKHDPEWRPRAKMLAARVVEFSQFMDAHARPAHTSDPSIGRTVYHASCHLQRGLGVDQAPKRLLEAATGTAAATLPDECCGFGGMFAIEHADISSEMLERRLEQIAASGADTVVACDVGCLMHIDGGLRKNGSRVRCAHLAQVLAGQEPGLR